MSFGQAPVFEWAKRMGGSAYDVGFSKVDKSGNVYSTGYFMGTADFDPGVSAFSLTSFGNWDIFISKFDPFGNFLWAKSMGGIIDDVGVFVTVDKFGNVYTTGFFNGTVDFDPGTGIFNLVSNSYDLFILKLDALGNFVWAKNIGGISDDYGHSISVDSAGNVYTTGYFKDTVDFDPGVGAYNLISMGGEDIFVSKLDVFGNFVWAKSVGGAMNDDGYSIAVDVFGNVYTSGVFSGIVDFDPTLGTFNLTSSGGQTIFILKLDSLGNFLWAKNMVGNISNGGYNIAIDTIGSVHTTGVFGGTEDFDPGVGIFNLTSAGSYDLFVSKLDSAGNFVWAKAIGAIGTLNISGEAITVDALDNVYTTGFFNGTVDFDPGVGVVNLISDSIGLADTFISKLDAFGNFIWAKDIRGNSQALGVSISVDAGYNVYTAGAFEGTFDFDPDGPIYNLTSAGSLDVFIQKMSQGATGIVQNITYQNSISLFPNPTSNNLTIETTKPTNISIVNILGQELFNSKIEKSETIEVSFLSNGIYFVKDLQNGGSMKFIKQ